MHKTQTNNLIRLFGIINYYYYLRPKILNKHYSAIKNPKYNK